MPDRNGQSSSLSSSMVLCEQQHRLATTNACTFLYWFVGLQWASTHKKAHIMVNHTQTWLVFQKNLVGCGK